MKGLGEKVKKKSEQPIAKEGATAILNTNTRLRVPVETLRRSNEA